MKFSIRHPALYWSLFFIVACAAPVVWTDSYYRHLLVLFGIFAILALSLDIIIGYLGELTLGHAAFFATGAYVSALLATNFELPFWVTLPTAGLAAGCLGVLVGIPSFRLKGPYFAIVTLSFAQIIGLIITNWISITRGPMGITKIPAPKLDLPFLPLIEFNTELSYYYIVLALVCASIFVTRTLIASRTGRAIIAIRENDALAKSIGIDVYRYKIVAFGIGTALAGVSGAAYAHYVRVVTPHLADLYYMSNALIMVVVGGAGSITGALLGSFVFTVVPESLRIVGDARGIIFGVVLLLAIIYLPDGISRAIKMFFSKTRKMDETVEQKTSCA